MAKAKKKSSKKSAGFFAKMFDILTAAVILGVIGGAVYLYFNMADDKPVLKKDKDPIKELYEEKKPAKAPVTDKTEKKIEDDFDESADHEEMERIDKGIISGYDEFSDQYEDEMYSNFSSDGSAVETDAKSEGFYASVNKWAKKYEGYAYKSGADPDKQRAADNSYLICSIWKNSAKENGRYFKGYLPTTEILKKSKKIDHADLRNGDLVVLQDKTMGMVVNYKKPNDFRLIFASETKKKVLVSDYNSIISYWLQPENFLGYYRPSKEILN
jgi:hypothetical protein